MKQQGGPKNAMSVHGFAPFALKSAMPFSLNSPFIKLCWEWLGYFVEHLLNPTVFLNFYFIFILVSHPEVLQDLILALLREHSWWVSGNET